MKPSPQWRGVHEAALGPQGVEAALQPKGCVLAKMALEYLTVVAHLLNDASGPDLGETQALAQAWINPRAYRHLSQSRTFQNHCYTGLYGAGEIGGPVRARNELGKQGADFTQGLE